MLSLVIQNCAERVRVQPGRRKDVGASLAFEEEREPEGNVASLRWIQRLQRTLPICQLVCLWLSCVLVNGGVLEGHVHREARVSLVFGAV